MPLSVVGAFHERKNPVKGLDIAYQIGTIEHMFAVDHDIELPPQASHAEIELLTTEERDRWDTDTPETHQAIPDRFDEMAPGPFLAAILSGVALPRLTGGDLVSTLRAISRLISHLQSKYYEAIAEISHRVDAEMGRSEDWVEFSSEEIRTALMMTRRAADIEHGLAMDLVERLPDVGNALASGTIDLRRARVISSGTGHLAEETARDVSVEALQSAASLTTGQLAARLRKLCISENPEEAADRYQHALEERRVFTAADPDGTADLMGMKLPGARVGAISKKLDRMARDLKRGGDERTMDQLRADVFLDLLDGKTSSGNVKGTVHITTELTTLARLDDNPGHLAGMGPVIADINRQVAAEQVDGEWIYTVTHNGKPVATGTTKRRPTTAMQAHIRAAYPTCVVPGCRMPSVDCDIDHRRPWVQGGATCNHNLGPLCRHHHTIKTLTRWKLDRIDDGAHTWTSPLGHTYRSTRGPPD